MPCANRWPRFFGKADIRDWWRIQIRLTLIEMKSPAEKSRSIPFFKLHGAGNDILVVESRHLPKMGKAKLFRQMAHRQLGLGCDQFVEVLSKKPLQVQIWNGDGSKAEMCANGFRVLLFLAAKLKWISSSAEEIPVKVSGKLYKGIRAKNGYEVCLGLAEVKPLQLLALDGKNIPFHEVSVGNPHAVIFMGFEFNPPKFSFRETGAKIEGHPQFPKKTNVEFVKAWSAKGKFAKALVDVWERGAGATLSCGSGAVAVAAVIRKISGVEDVSVEMNGFTLRVRFEGERAFLGGPSTLVAHGNYLVGSRE